MTSGNGAPESMSSLLALARAGDLRAREDLLVRVHTLAYRYCRLRLPRSAGVEHGADDVAQEVCVAVLSSLPRYTDEGKPFEAFVYRIAANKVADAQRQVYRRPQVVGEVPDVVDLTDGPERLAERAEDARYMHRLLEDLKPQHREVVYLRVGAGLSAEETAAALGLSIGNVRVIQHRVLSRLRELTSAELERRPT